MTNRETFQKNNDYIELAKVFLHFSKKNNIKFIGEKKSEEMTLEDVCFLIKYIEEHNYVK